jgi:hypothetical protein
MKDLLDAAAPIDFIVAFICIAAFWRGLPTSTPVVGRFPFSFQLTRTACLAKAGCFWQCRFV